MKNEITLCVKQFDNDAVWAYLCVCPDAEVDIC